MELLYRYFYPPMLRFAVIRTGNKMVAEDLVHNVWIKVGKRVLILNDVSLFRAWLFKALRWEILDWVKSSHQSLTASVDELDDEVADSALDITRILPLMSALDQDEQDIVELYYINDLSLNETALTLDIPSGTVKSRLSRARNKIRKHLNEENRDEYR